MEGTTEGAMDGATEGATEGAMDMVGAEVGIREGGPEMHVGRPEPAQAGYTQAEVETKVSIPNEVPAQFSITAILRRLQSRNAESPIDVTLLGIVTENRKVQPWNAEIPIDVTLLGILIEVRELQS